MNPQDLRSQIRGSYERRALESRAVHALAARIRASAAGAQAARRGARRTWWTVAAAVAVIATAVLVARVVLRERRPAVVAADSRLPPSLREAMRVVDEETCPFDGVAGTQLRLVDAEGAVHCLVEVPLPEGALRAESIEMRVEGAIVRTWVEDGRLLGLASPSPLPSRTAGVRKATTLVSVEPKSSTPEQELDMNSQMATSRLARLALVALATATLAAEAAPVPAPLTSHGVEIERAPAPAPPQLVAVKFHADWCRLCQRMGTIFDDLADRLDGQPVLFVEVDITNETTRRQSAYLAAGLGLDEVWQAHGRAAGFILLVDAQTKQVVGRLNADLSLDQMAAETSRALRSRT